MRIESCEGEPNDLRWQPIGTTEQVFAATMGDMVLAVESIQAGAQFVLQTFVMIPPPEQRFSSDIFNTTTTTLP